MLPTTAQHRVWRHVPGNSALDPGERSGLDIDYFTPDGEYVQARDVELDVFWAEEEYSPRYPCCSLELSPTSVQRYDGNQLSDTIRKVARPGDPTVAYDRIEATELYDLLTIQVAVRDDYRTSTGAVIPRSAFAKELAQAVFASFRFETDYLNEPGVMADGSPLFGEDAHVDAEDWAQPMVVVPVAGAGMTRNAAMVDEQHTDRYAMQFEIEYELTREVVVEAVEAIEYTVYLDGSPVTRERVATARPTVARGVSPVATRGSE